MPQTQHIFTRMRKQREYISSGEWKRVITRHSHVQVNVNRNAVIRKTRDNQLTCQLSKCTNLYSTHTMLQQQSQTSHIRHQRPLVCIVSAQFHLDTPEQQTEQNRHLAEPSTDDRCYELAVSPKSRVYTCHADNFLQPVIMDHITYGVVIFGVCSKSMYHSLAVL